MQCLPPSARNRSSLGDALANPPEGFTMKGRVEEHGAQKLAAAIPEEFFERSSIEPTKLLSQKDRSISRDNEKNRANFISFLLV